MILRRIFITILAVTAVALSTSAQAWGDKLIKRMQSDANVQKNVVVNRNPDSRKIDTESYTFRFSSTPTFNQLEEELKRHFDDAITFTQDDAKGRVAMRVKADGNRIGLYELRKEGTDQYCFKVYRAEPGSLHSYSTVDDADYTRISRKARAEAQKARQEAQKEAQKARIEAQKVRREAQQAARKARQEAQQEAQKARNEARKIRLQSNSKAASTSRVKVITAGDKAAKAKEASAHENEVKRKLAERKKGL